MLATIQNLQGKTDHPTAPTSFLLDEEELLGKLKGTDRTLTLRVTSTFRLMLACIFGDLETAENMVGIIASAPPVDMLYARWFRRATYFGLATLDLAQKEGCKKYLAQGKGRIKILKAKVKHGSMNLHLILLML
jgi:hypothetical protein